MGITANVKSDQIVASVGETKIDVTVSGGVGPTGPAGPAGASSWNDITGKPTFAAVATSGAYSDLTGIPAEFVLPTATASVLGGVKIGSGISIDGSGVISASSAYTLPTASASVLGGVKIGSGVTITDGVISVSTDYAASSHTHDSLTSGTDTLALDGSGAITLTHSPGGGSLEFPQSTGSLARIVAPSTQGLGIYSGHASEPVYIYTVDNKSIGGLYLGDIRFAADNSLQTTAWLGTVDWADVTNQPTLFDGAYTSLTSVPSTFAPSSHKTSHATGGSDALTASDIGAAAASHAHAWSDIASGVPSTFPPSAHNHAASAITSGTLSASLLPSSGVVAGTYTSVTVDTYGRVTAGSSPSIAYSSLTGLPTLGNSAALNTGTTAGTVATGDHTHAQLHDRSHAITSSSDHTATAWRLFHSNGSGQIVELAFGNGGQALLSNGASAAPSWGQAGSNSASDLTQGTLANARMSARARAAMHLYLWSSFR